MSAPIKSIIGCIEEGHEFEITDNGDDVTIYCLEDDVYVTITEAEWG